jgi:hypothetical protein
MHQPFTTDSTTTGSKAARNAMRLRLWADDYFAHRWLCHPGEECRDGCDVQAAASRVDLYQSDVEQ